MDYYSIKNIINYRQLDWGVSEEFLYLTDIPEVFEPFLMKPDYFSYGLINSGSMLIEVDHESFRISPQSLLVYRPNQTLKILEIEPGTKGAFVLFTKKFIDYLFESFFSIAPHSFLQNRFGSHIIMSQSDYTKMDVLFSKTIDFLNASEADTDRWVYSAKSILLALINESDFVLEKYKPTDKNENDHREEEIGREFKRLIAMNYLSDRHVEFYSAKLNITSNYLHKIIKSRYDQTPFDLINNALLSECKSRLSYSEASIGEIADELNFGSIQSFSKYFKKHTGQSPSLFRKDQFSQKSTI